MNHIRRQIKPMGMRYWNWFRGHKFRGVLLTTYNDRFRLTDQLRSNKRITACEAIRTTVGTHASRQRLAKAARDPFGAGREFRW